MKAIPAGAFREHGPLATPWLPTSLLLVLAACTHSAAVPADSLAQRIAGLSAGPPQACVPAESNRNLVAVDRATLVYDRGTAIYVNRLAGACPGLRATSTIVVLASMGGQYCRGDRIQAHEPGSSFVSGPTCLLGEWLPYRR